MELRDRWVGYIVQQNSIIFNLKRKMVTAHSWAVIILLVQIFFHEILLGLASLPSYFFLSTKTLPHSNQQSYRLRRAATLLFLIPLTCLWTARLTIIILEKVQGNLTDFSAGPRGSGVGGASQAWWRLVMQTPESPRIASPIFLKSPDQSSSLFIEGTAQRGTKVLVAFQRQVALQAVLLLPAQIEDNGHWVISKTTVKDLSPGIYNISAVAYDEVHHERSQMSPAVDKEVQKNLWQTASDITGYTVYITVSLILLLGIIFSFIGK